MKVLIVTILCGLTACHWASAGKLCGIEMLDFKIEMLAQSMNPWMVAKSNLMEHTCVTKCFNQGPVKGYVTVVHANKTLQKFYLGHSNNDNTSFSTVDDKGETQVWGVPIFNQTKTGAYFVLVNCKASKVEEVYGCVKSTSDVKPLEDEIKNKNKLKDVKLSTVWTSKCSVTEDSKNVCKACKN